ncbi:MAG TPA: hypothetical protein PKX87_06790 [Alphaproteobacteria bacterium]|nr:hypothetical protein [Alphaproteobacteria bacterium]
MAYQTLCHRFSVNSTRTAADMIGLASCAGMNAVMNADLSSTLIGSVLLGAATGPVGWVAGALAENFTQKALSGSGIGVTRGSRIVQAAGVGGYGVFLGAMLGLNHMMIVPFMESANTPPRSPERPIAASVATLPHSVPIPPAPRSSASVPEFP